MRANARAAAAKTLAAACLLAAALAAPARADTRELAGDALVLSTTMSSDTVIGTDPALAGHVRVSMDGSAACLTATGGGAVTIGTARCADDAGTLRIEVPPGMPLTVTVSGDGSVRLADTMAPLILTLNGSGDVTGGKLGRLLLAVHGSSDVRLGAIQGGAELEMTGSGDVRLAGVEGAVVLKHHGSGDLAVGHVEAPAVVIESTGSGDMLFGAGTIGSLTAHMQGDGDLAVAAPVHDADIQAYGGGDVKLGVVSGTLHRANGDGSDIIVGGPSVVNAVIGRVARQIGTGNDHSVVVVHGSHSFGHFLTFVAICVMAYIVWRIMRRRGGIASLRQAPPAPALHPGIAAIAETLKRVEDRLGRVEGYVTSREFDLQQKFKKL